MELSLTFKQVPFAANSCNFSYVKSEILGELPMGSKKRNFMSRSRHIPQVIDSSTVAFVVEPSGTFRPKTSGANLREFA